MICSLAGGRMEGTGRTKLRRLERIVPLSDRRMYGSDPAWREVEESGELTADDCINSLSTGEFLIR